MPSKPPGASPCPTRAARRSAGGSRNLLHLIGVPLLFLLAVAVADCHRAVLSHSAAPSGEDRSRALRPRRSGTFGRDWRVAEDHDVTNQFTAMGSLKPGTACGWRRPFSFSRSSITPRGTSSRRGRLGAHPHDSFCALGLSRRPEADGVFQQLRRQRRELHGRLHQQDRLRAQRRFQQRHRLSAAPIGSCSTDAPTSKSTRSTCAATRCRRRSGTRPIPV